jgi:plastocyanin
MRRGVVIVASGLLLFAAAGCGGGYGSGSKSQSSTTTKSSSGGGQKTIAGVSANDHGTKSVSGKTAVSLGDYFFKPTVIEGKSGSKVTLELKNVGQVAHTFTIDSQKIDQNLDPGASATVTVTIPKTGAVSFYCRYHRSSGMAGALAVAGTGGMTGSGGTGGTTTSSNDGY